MSEVVQETSHEFWRPPSPVVPDEIVIRETIPTMAEACSRCGTEFLLGSCFCHTCGNRRTEAISPAAKADSAALAGLWEQGLLRRLLPFIPRLRNSPGARSNSRPGCAIFISTRSRAGSAFRRPPSSHS